MIDPAQVQALDAAVGDAFRTGDDSALSVLGYGEITLVLGWPPDAPRLAVKRLPVFPTTGHADAYEEVFRRYLAELAARGVGVVDTSLARVPAGTGHVLYIVQSLLAPDQLLPARLHALPAADAGAVLSRVVDTVVAVCDDTLGIDAQATNWALDGDRLVYFDVSTPFLRDASGRSLVDMAPFLTALPAVLRAPVRRFVVPGVLTRYHDRRAVLLDFVANLARFGLAHLRPAALERVNATVDRPVTLDEAERYYRSEARLWRAMLGIRRAERLWQRRVRRRPYPYLLPPDSDW